VDRFKVSLLQKLPKDGMLSVALDYWTSRFQQSFLTIWDYYIDTSWLLYKVVLGFKPFYSTHSGKNLSRELVRVLLKHRAASRPYTITTDNASNNASISRYAAKFCSNHTKGRHFPCLAHIQQPALQNLLFSVKANLTNESDVKTGSDEMALSLHTYFGVGADL
jgi:hypothetical protein